MEKIKIRLFRFLLKNDVLFQFIQFLGMIILSVGSYALAGYVAHRDHYYKWASDVGMALNTSILFVVVGIVILLIMIKVRSMEDRIDALERTLN